VAQNEKFEVFDSYVGETSRFVEKKTPCPMICGCLMHPALGTVLSKTKYLDPEGTGKWFLRNVGGSLLK
jgi:hypothetical protein